MVMKKNIMGKNLRQSIRKSLGRYIAIVLIIALGAGMFVGLLSTKADMVATAQSFTDQHNMFHLRLINTYGWAKEDVAAVAKMSGVVQAEGSVTLDAVGRFGKSDEAVYRLHAIPETINTVNLLGGRMPENPNECLMDGHFVDDSVLGTVFTVSEENEESTLEGLSDHSFTVVGYVSTPLYMDMSRGSTTIGSGELASYLYIPAEAFQVDYFTEIYVTIEGDFDVYSDELNQAMEDMAEKLEPAITVLAQQRYVNVKQDAQSQYDQGMADYLSGREEFESGRTTVLKELAEAFDQLQNAQAEIDSNKAVLEDAYAQLQAGQKELDDNRALITASRIELQNAKADTYTQLADAWDQLTVSKKEATDGLAQVNEGLAQINDGIAQLEDALPQIADGLAQLEDGLPLLEIALELTKGALELAKLNPLVSQETLKSLQDKLDQQQAEYDSYLAQQQELLEMQATYTAQLADLKKQRTELLATQKTITDGLAAIENGFLDIERGRTQAELKFASAEAELDSAELQLDSAQQELDQGWKEYNEGKAQLDDAQAQLDTGWAEYEAGKAEAQQELDKAEQELNDAAQKLADAKHTIDTMEDPAVYLLDRNTNVGYLAVNSSSDIVAGVSRVFPAFFLLVAALVCITTMTRMIEEERTQIGVLKALGYSNSAIINKYLIYSGSAAIVGCGLGVIIGSVVFPIILWNAYSLMLNLQPNVVLGVNWPLCLAVVGAYTAVSMLVTWYCCRQSLKDVPAELMRPKAPTAGKKIWMEYLPFWNKISFLNKVMFRNVFRYRQRLLMMLIGIGGCTALLLTGFGVWDSIVDIVGYQYAEITTYDVEVYFSEGQTTQQQDHFRQELRQDVDDILFFYQARVDLEFDDNTKSLTLISADSQVTDFINMERNGKEISMPGAGEGCLTVGIADAMGVKVGDTVVLRDAEMRPLTLKITGIFTNYVNNFIITCPESLESQWGEVPQSQMAYITVHDSQDPHNAGAKISGMSGVLNVTVCQDAADQVSSMLGALDSVVLTIVVCAGLLAAVVLYNLTNISITERIREIATIKVLGFNSKESALYVFKENLFLSGLGSIVGLFGGILLLKFVMSQIKIDMVWFTDRLKPMSYVWAVVLTMVCACIVDFFLYFKLEKINMAEALKSVE